MAEQGHCTYDIRLTSDKKIVIKSENIHSVVGNDAVNDTLNMTSIINIDEHNFMKMKKILNEIKKNRNVDKSKVEDGYIYEFYVDDTLIRRSIIQDDNIFRILDCFARKLKIREFACDQFFVTYKENLDRINKKKKKKR